MRKASAMFGFSMWEVLIILGVILVVLGPTFIPKMGRRVGDMVLGFRKAADQLQDSMHAEIDTKTEDEDKEKKKLSDGSSSTADDDDRSKSA